MEKKNSLIPIERKGIRVYDCPLCDLKIVGTLDEATKHVGIPLSRGTVLPRGFVFGSDSSKKFNKNSTSIKVIHYLKQMSAYDVAEHGFSASYGILTTHDFKYWFEEYEYNHYKKEHHPNENRWDMPGWNYKYSDVIKDCFSNGEYFLLNKEQFEEFKEMRKAPKNLDLIMGGSPENSKLIRTVKGIENFLLEKNKK